MTEEEEEATETTEMLIDVENLEIEGEDGKDGGDGGRRGRANMSRIEFWARGGLNQSCGEKCLMFNSPDISLSSQVRRRSRNV